MKPILSIIIPTYGREEIFLESINSVINACVDLEVEIIVVNDLKTKDVVLPANITRDKVIVINNPGQGASSSRNFGVKHCSSDLLLFIDNDVLISKTNLITTIAFHRENKKACLNLNWIYPNELLVDMEKTSFGRFLLKEKLIDYRSWYPYANFQENSVFESEVLATFYLSLEKNSFLEINGFNEDIPYLTEDDDLTRRLKAAGNKLIIDSRETVFHNEKDRIILENRLERTKMHGAAFKRSYLNGKLEYEIKYSKSKWFTLSLIRKSYGFWFLCLKIIPNSRKFDFIYNKMIHLLYATKIYEGYSSLKQ